jgi:hypothetical protein
MLTAEPDAIAWALDVEKEVDGIALVVHQKMYKEMRKV